MSLYCIIVIIDLDKLKLMHRILYKWIDLPPHGSKESYRPNPIVYFLNNSPTYNLYRHTIIDKMNKTARLPRYNSNRYDARNLMTAKNNELKDKLIEEINKVNPRALELNHLMESLQESLKLITMTEETVKGSGGNVYAGVSMSDDVIFKEYKLMTPDDVSKKVLTTSYYKLSPGGGKKNVRSKRNKCMHMHTCKRKRKHKRVSMKMN